MRIGIFGGTFDPPHLGHMALCRQAFNELGLERLLWLLTANPPHKRGHRITALEHRLAMVTLALAGTPYELSRLELDRPGPHYAADTVAILAQAHSGADLVYLMGADSLNDLPTWHRPAEFVRRLHAIGVMQRDAETPDLPALEAAIPGLGARLRFVAAPRVDISASQVRTLARAGQPYAHLLVPAVADYIREHGLYRIMRNRKP